MCSLAVQVAATFVELIHRRFGNTPVVREPVAGVEVSYRRRDEAFVPPSTVSTPDAET